jgi:hypothetical protein
MTDAVPQESRARLQASVLEVSSFLQMIERRITLLREAADHDPTLAADVARLDGIVTEARERLDALLERFRHAD